MILQIQRKVLFLLLIIFIVSSCTKDDQKDPIPVIPVCETETASKHLYNVEFQQILDRYVAEGLPGISAAIYTPDEGLWLGVAGMANIAGSDPMSTCNSLFSGSTAKMYTVSAAMSLYEEGLLDLDAKISSFLSQRLIDSLPNVRTATIRQLMNHTAGMYDYDNSAGLSNYVISNNGNLPTLENQLAYIFDVPANFSPGEGVEYSSTHTATLSLVLDSISGSHHSLLFTDRIIDKLQLEETYYKNEEAYPSPTNLVSGYLGFGAEAQDFSEIAINYCNGSQGDAGVIATAADYYLFLKGLFEFGIVNSTTLNEMTVDPQWAFEFGDFKYGYGLGLIMIESEGSIFKMGHSGATGGGMTHVYYYPQSGAYLVVCTNTLLEDGPGLDTWSGNLILNPNESSIMGDFERIILP